MLLVKSLVVIFIFTQSQRPESELQKLSKYSKFLTEAENGSTPEYGDEHDGPKDRVG